MNQDDRMDEQESPEAPISMVLTWPDPWLRTKSQEVDHAYASGLIVRLLRTMRAYKAVGLSAVLIGEAARVAVLDLSSSDQKEEQAHLALINPEIKSMSKRMIEVELGCVSLPGIMVKVKRPESVVVTTERIGLPGRVAFEFKGMLAANVLHQLDLMDGIGYWQRLSGVKRRSILNQYRRRLEAEMADEAADGLVASLSEV